MNLVKWSKRFWRTGITKSIFLRKQKHFNKAQLIIKIFYFLLFWLAFESTGGWERYMNISAIEPLWPIYWIKCVTPYSSACYAILVAYLITTLSGIVFSRFRVVRFFIFLGLLQYSALTNSFGKINHGLHLYVMISFLLIFLPNGWHLNNDSVSRCSRNIM